MEAQYQEKARNSATTYQIQKEDDSDDDNYDHDDCVLNVYDFYDYDPYKICHASVYFNYL